MMTPRLPSTLILAALAVTAAACTTTGEPRRNSYAADVDRLTAECRARNGILVPNGASTGRAETDYACRISGATRLD